MTARIDAWETSDSLIFRSYDEAEEHETKLQFIKFCEDNLDFSCETSAIAETLFQHWNITPKD